LSVQRVTHSWAGLRSFVADRSPVAGFAPDSEGFLWLAAQGGYGIQMAPALARAAAALAMRQEVSADIVEHGVVLAEISPQRLASRA
jgi:D-arginine dehydrogenase